VNSSNRFPSAKLGTKEKVGEDCKPIQDLDKGPARLPLGWPDLLGRTRSGWPDSSDSCLIFSFEGEVRQFLLHQIDAKNFGDRKQTLTMCLHWGRKTRNGRVPRMTVEVLMRFPSERRSFVRRSGHASVPSSTALNTSLASARVGRLECSML